MEEEELTVTLCSGGHTQSNGVAQWRHPVDRLGHQPSTMLAREASGAEEVEVDEPGTPRRRPSHRHAVEPRFQAWA